MLSCSVDDATGKNATAEKYIGATFVICILLVALNILCIRYISSLYRQDPCKSIFRVLFIINYSHYLDAELESWRGAGRPATTAEEAEDERRDADLLAAVRDSMEQWEQKRARTRYSVATITLRFLRCTSS